METVETTSELSSPSRSHQPRVRRECGTPVSMLQLVMKHLFILMIDSLSVARFTQDTFARILSLVSGTEDSRSPDSVLVVSSAPRVARGTMGDGEMLIEADSAAIMQRAVDAALLGDLSDRGGSTCPCKLSNNPPESESRQQHPALPGATSRRHLRVR